MSLIVPDTGLKRILDWITGAVALPSNIYLGAFTNNITPAEGTTWASLTEAAVAGYARKALAKGSWVAATTSTPRAVSTYGTTPQSWTPTSGTETWYGVFLLDTTDNTLIAAELFSSPITVSSSLGVSYLPRLTTRSEF